VGLVLVPQAWFEPNVVNMRDPTTESVGAFYDLLDDSGFASPWFVNTVAPDFESAEALAARARELDAVESTLLLPDFVPEDQEEKLEILADAESTVAILGRLQETLESTLRAQGIELESFDVSHGGEGAPDADTGTSSDAADRSSDQPDFELESEPEDGVIDDTETDPDTRQHGANVLHL